MHNSTRLKCVGVSLTCLSLSVETCILPQHVIHFYGPCEGQGRSISFANSHVFWPRLMSCGGSANILWPMEGKQWQLWQILRTTGMSYVCPHCMTTFFDSANSFTLDLLTQIRANHLDETFKTLQESPWIIFSPCQRLFAPIWLSNWSTHYIMPSVRHSSCSNPFVRDDYAISDPYDVVACPTTSWRSSGAWESSSSDAWPMDTAFADVMWSTPRNCGLGFQICFKNLMTWYDF